MKDFWDGLAAVVLDMDGVVFIGKRRRRGVNELLERMVQRGVDYHILTNTSASSATEIATKLAAMGVRVEPDRITNASELAAGYVRDRCHAEAVFTLGGGNGLASALEACGVRQVALESTSLAEAQRLRRENAAELLPLIIGWTSSYDYELATKALALEELVSRVYVTGVDRSFAVEDGNVPGIGWVGGSIGALLDKEPVNVGKPNPYALEYALNKLGCEPGHAAIIGDSISDIQIGNELSCRTVLVLGGTTPASALDGLDARFAPGLIIKELTDLL